MRKLHVTGDTSKAEIDAFQQRRCGRCGFQALEHAHLFGTGTYLCPTVATFSEQDEKAVTMSVVKMRVRVGLWLMKVGARLCGFTHESCDVSGAKAVAVFANGPIRALNIEAQ